MSGPDRREEGHPGERKILVHIVFEPNLRGRVVLWWCRSGGKELCWSVLCVHWLLVRISRGRAGQRKPSQARPMSSSRMCAMVVMVLSLNAARTAT